MKSGERSAWVVLTLTMATLLSACTDPEVNDNDMATASRDTADGNSGVPTAVWPADACGWISGAEVAAIVGPLAGEPVIVGSLDTPRPFPNGRACLYRLVSVSTAQTDLRRAISDWRAENMPGPAQEEDTTFGDSSVIIAVKLDGDTLEERAGGAAWRTVASAGGFETTPEAEDRRRASARGGWDYVGASFISLASPVFIGRIGHVRIEVLSPAELSEEMRAAVAAHVRDKIVDLPFRARDGAIMRDLQPTSEERAGPTPCALLTREEAEAVIGPLVVPPYRAAENAPFVHERGESCAYYTAGHRVLLVTPRWSYGKSEFDAETALGGLIGGVMPDAERDNADLLEGDWDGPWDDATANGMTGEALFLKGDRLLKIAYGMSGLDATATLPLAYAAIKRL